MMKIFDWIKKHKPTFTKLIIGWIVLNGTAWTWCSYYLAYIGRSEIAEALSRVVVTEILGVVAVYAIKALLENFSKNNKWPDRSPKDDKRDCN